MATYGQLLIDAGGGVIDHGKQSDRQDGATVIIGLGGTGKDAVKKIKSEVYKQLKPDDVNAVIPKYSDIKYLVIDSDDDKIAGKKAKISDIDRNTEYFSISNDAIKATFGAKKIMDNRPELFWLDYEHIDIDMASHGAGGIRQVGRFLLVDRASQLYVKIKAVLSSALLGSNGKLTIHICSGLSGGTGSGMFLDICYLVRQALSEIGKEESKVCGYLFLPDVNLSIPEISANSLLSSYIKVNGYAALQELDYCMNFAKNKDSFQMNYGFLKVDFSMMPVDLCYLISTTDAEGRSIEGGYRYAMGVVTDFIINFLAKVNLPEGIKKDTNGLTLEGHISNLNAMKAGIKLQHGAGVDYNILGAAVAEMPLAEIATYLGAKLFENYREIYDKVPTEKERDIFVVNNQLQYEDIKKTLTKNCIPTVIFPKRYDVKMYRERGNHLFLDFAAEYLAKNMGELEKNVKTLTDHIKEYQIPETTTSLINRTYKTLCDSYVTKLEYGPFFAKRLLYGSNNQNLIHKVDGFITTNQEKLEHEMRQARLRDEEYADAQARMDNANILNEKSRLEAYLNALTNLYVHHYKVETYKSLNTVLQDYKQQLLELDRNFFDILTIILDTLKNTFEENARILTEGEKTENVYNWKILSVPDIIKGLDEEVQKLDIDQTLYHLMQTMFSQCPKWINEDENEIIKLISDFILNQFRNATRKTITDYLKVKFEVDNLTLLADRIEEEIMKGKLGKDSTPMFWQNPMYHNPVGAKSTLTVPFDAAEIKAAAYSYQSSEQEFTVRESSITDKISMMRFYSGLPMFAYHGIMELQRAYEADKKPGRHLYERGEIDWNIILPAPIPASFEIGIPIERIARKNAALLAEFERAESIGIIAKDTLAYWSIQVTETIEIDKWISDLGGYETNGKIDRNKLNRIITILEEKAHELTRKARSVRIEALNSNEGSERQVMLDFYLLSPVLNHLVNNELRKNQEFNNKIEELKMLVEKTTDDERDKADFFNAIFTGIITYGKKVVYHYNEFGVPKSIELQNNNMEYGDSGAYQAFITYRTLDIQVRRQISVAAKTRMDEEDSPETRVAITDLDDNMVKRLTVYRSTYGTLHPLHEDVEQFYTDFMKALERFKLMNI